MPQMREHTLFGMIPQRPELADYVARLTARDAFRRAEEKDKQAGGG